MMPEKRFSFSQLNLRAALPFAFSVITLMLIGLTWDSLNPFLQLGGLGLSVFTLLLWVLLYARVRTVKLPKVLIPILCFWAYQTVTIAWSLHPIPALQKSLINLLLISFFVLIFDTMSGPFDSWTWFNALLGVGIIISLLELVLFLFWITRWWLQVGSFPSLPPVGYRLQGLLLGHANVTAGYVNLLLPAAVFKLARSSKVSNILGWLVILILFGSVEYFASSRGGWLSGILGIGFVLVYLLWERFGDWQSLLRAAKAHRGRLAAITMTGLVLGVALATIFLLQVQKTGHGIGFGSRDYIWKPAIAMIEERPLLGHGWGSFSTLYSQKTYTPPGFATSHAHNILLQIWAEHGLIGVGFLLIIILFTTRCVIHAWRQGDTQHRPLIVMAISSLVPVASHQMVDYLFESPLYTIGVLVWLASLYRYSLRRDSLAISGKILSYSLGLVLLLTGLAYSSIAPGSFDYWSGVTAFRSGNITVSTEKICAAAEENPGFSLYWFECAISRAFLAEQKDSSVLAESARDALLSGLKSDPYWAPHWANLSAIQWRIGDTQSALDSIAKAMQIAPNNGKFPQFEGYLFEVRGEYGSAFSSYLKGLTLDPWLSFDPFFQESEVRILAFDEFSRSYVESHRTDLWGAWYSTSLGDLETARSIFEQMWTHPPEIAYSYAGLAYVALRSGNFSEALNMAKAALFIQPLMPRALEIAYYSAKNLGLTAEAIKYNEDYHTSQLATSQSWQYFNRTYLKFFIPPDAIPQFSLPLIGELK